MTIDFSNNIKKKRHYYLLISFFVIFSIVCILWQGVLFAGIVGLILSIWLLSYHLEFGLYILVFLAPLRYWIISLKDYPSILALSPKLSEINAPVVEFWAVLMLICWLLSMSRRLYHGQSIILRLPAAHWYGLFILTAVLSLVSVKFDYSMSYSVWYITRYLIFYYIAFLALGASLITSRRIWENSLRAFAFVGLLAVLMGLASLVLGVWHDVYGIFRVTPFSISGWAPFGDQHIFFAEALVAVFPVALYFYNKQKTDSIQRRLLLLFVFAILVTTFLTLSRAGFLALLAECLVAVLLWRDNISLSAFFKRWRLAALAVVPLVIYFIYFLTTSGIVRGSNATRLTLTEISWHYFLLHPVIGNGVGTFVQIVTDTWYFIFEFGDPVDAHGFIQKLITEQGILGFVTFFAFIFILIKRLLASVHQHASETDSELRGLPARYGLMMLAGILVFQMFNTQYYSSVMWAPLALAVAASFIRDNNFAQNTSPNFLSASKRFFIEYK